VWMHLSNQLCRAYQHELHQRGMLVLRQRGIRKRFSLQVEGLIIRELAQACVPGYTQDVLTGAQTRHQLIRDIADATMDRGDALQQPFTRTYLCIDIDRFKGYLDVYGLTAGDQVLVTLAQQLRTIYPRSPLYRFSGEEFVVDLGVTTDVQLPTIPQITLKYSRVMVNYTREANRIDFLNKYILFSLERGMVEASSSGSSITV
jgi:diguanylate cyclase (GGDEF)-like protein